MCSLAQILILPPRSAARARAASRPAAPANWRAPRRSAPDPRHADRVRRCAVPRARPPCAAPHRTARCSPPAGWRPWWYGTGRWAGSAPSPGFHSTGSPPVWDRDSRPADCAASPDARTRRRKSPDSTAPESPDGCSSGRWGQRRRRPPRRSAPPPWRPDVRYAERVQPPGDLCAVAHVREHVAEGGLVAGHLQAHVEAFSHAEFLLYLGKRMLADVDGFGDAHLARE